VARGPGLIIVIIIDHYPSLRVSLFKFSKLSSLPAARGHWPHNQNPADARGPTTYWRCPLLAVPGLCNGPVSVSLTSVRFLSIPSIAAAFWSISAVSAATSGQRQCCDPRRIDTDLFHVTVSRRVLRHDEIISDNLITNMLRYSRWKNFLTICRPYTSNSRKENFVINE